MEENYNLLPSIDVIKQYSVADLLEEVEDFESFEELTGKSKVFQTAIHICQLISINEKKFTTSEFVEYKDGTHSVFMLGNTHVTNGAVAILSLAASSGLFKNRLDEDVTIFEFKKILDSLEPRDNVDGKIGAYIRKFIERKMIEEYRKSGMLQVSQRLLDRFKKELKNDIFLFKDDKFSIKDESYCESVFNTPIYKQLKDEIREEKVYRDVIHSVPLWPGNPAVIKTEEIKRLLIDIVCIFKVVDFKLFFREFKYRAQDWMLTTPLSYNSEFGNDYEEGTLVLEELLSGDTLLEERERNLFLEKEAISLVNFFDNDELFLIQQKLQGNTIAEMGQLIGLGTSATGERLKKVLEKLGTKLEAGLSNLNTSSYSSEDYEIAEVMEAFSNEIKNRRITPEIV